MVRVFFPVVVVIRLQLFNVVQKNVLDALKMDSMNVKITYRKKIQIFRYIFFEMHLKP